MPAAPTVVEAVGMPTAPPIVITARVARTVAIVRSKARSPFAPHVLSAFMTLMALVIAIISGESRARAHDCQSCSQSQYRQFEFLQHNCLLPTLCLLDAPRKVWLPELS